MNVYETNGHILYSEIDDKNSIYKRKGILI